VLAGHSGAGVFLPVVAAATGATLVVFIDAVLPAADTSMFEPPADFTTFLDALVDDDGRLAPWHRWWPAGTMEELVSDPTLRARIEDETPRVPRSFYDEPVPLPNGWTRRRGGFLHLSGAYEDDAARATSYGWPVRTLDGRHLDLATRPDEVASLVVDLVSGADPAVTSTSWARPASTTRPP
jgi:hypothetical protein